MSKPRSQKNYQLDASKSVRLDSLSQLRKDFENKTNDEEEFYDRRVYYDPSTKIEYYPWMFSKTLDHDPTTGFPKKEDVEKVIEAYQKADQETINNVPKSSVSTRKLEGLSASQSFNLCGTDSSVPYLMPEAFFKVDSEKALYEMAEVYLMALNRDESFFGLIISGNSFINILEQFGDNITGPKSNSGITWTQLFRGNAPDETTGPYISQFLYLPFNYGNIPVTQQYISENDFEGSVTPEGWLAIQNGQVQGSIGQTSPKYVYNGRVLGAKVHNDPLYQFYYNAALIALENGFETEAFVNDKTTAWTSSGCPDILATVAHVALGALRVAWYHKWGTIMRIRPEVFAQRIQLAYESSDDFVDSVPGLRNIKDICDDKLSDLLNDVIDDNAEIVPPEFTSGTRVPSNPTRQSTEFGYTRYGTTGNSEEYKSYNENDVWVCSSFYEDDGTYSNGGVSLTTNGVTLSGSYTYLIFPSEVHIAKIKIGSQSNIVNGALHIVRNGQPNILHQFVSTPGSDFFINIDVNNVTQVFIQAVTITPGESNAKYGGIKFYKSTRYLKLQFPEGSPTHPSLPAGHACVAGACVTVLKAMFKTDDEDGNRLPWPLDVVHSTNGDTLRNWDIDFSHNCTIAGEFNKLASNVSIGRQWSGVHYRCDSDCGLDLGQQYAISYLVDKAKEYHESSSGLFTGFRLDKFDGSRVFITKDGVRDV